ncbi:MAG TPA: hypothetical protein DCG19_02845 [Cryomorphaceae bacterium]|nr:hypothetical protein [Owenweeksia sp.]MBF98966.1 hypothetical protein [Owenweeksia sp.]HAD96313.1 hypothetical protein [Cryomorphaceae bacterium]
MKNWLSLLLLMLGFSSYAQEIALEKTVQDLTQLKEAIQTYNPALELYNPGFEKQSAALINGIEKDPLPLVDYFKYVSQMCALSNEGHFALGNWEDTVHSGFLDNRYRYMPLSVKILEGKMYVWVDNSDEDEMKRGDEIMAINNWPAINILDLIYKAFPSDGGITTYVDRNIELGFSWLYYFYIGQPEYFDLRVRTTSGTVRDYRIKALTREEQFANFEQYYPKLSQARVIDTAGFYELTHEGDIAFLTLPSFDYSRVEAYDVKAKKMYKEIFKSLEGDSIKYLIVDLRDNTGGRNEFADKAVPYLLQEKSKDPFLKKTISWKGKSKKYKTPRPSRYAFKGKVYVLVNGRTYSAGSTLARYIKEYANAVVIGKETGTRYEGFAAGSKEYITLDNSGIRIGIPRYHILFPPARKQKTSNRGLLPDHQTYDSVQDVMQEKDVHIEKVRALIDKSRRSSK